jgi:hypothetical protein
MQSAAMALFAAYHSGYAIAVYISACAIVSLVAANFMPDYTGRDISMEYDDGRDIRFGSSSDILYCNHQCPLYPRQRTLIVNFGMSAKGQ